MVPSTCLPRAFEKNCAKVVLHHDNASTHSPKNIKGMKNKELEVELFMDSAIIDILCITENWLRNVSVLARASITVICAARASSPGPTGGGGPALPPPPHRPHPQL
ncbi:hypothetical protein EVAR_53661_1 [Eumeta japonica]|uniref:Uncharacterized protein n=1 Tax=Eumeta variegata TaxID=151549 RepID=A0A4C2A425_EUMVA|nr:hypothetical protein EVAR_53661_1 [Eumeta japonica]